MVEPVAMKRVFDVDASGNSQAPEQLHPGQISFADFGNNPALKEASEAFGYASEHLASIDRLRGNPHPEHTPARHARAVREALDSFDNAWAHKGDSAKAALKAEHRRVEADLERAANLKPTDKYANAILGTFQGLNPGERARELDQLIEAKDGATLAVLLEAPSLVTGITREQSENLKMRLYLKVNPEGVALRDQLARALVKYEAGSVACLSARAKLREGSDRFNARTKEAEALANKARTGFGA
jgi:hypothetical protein